MKSGLQLEVGARKAPRLLVIYKYMFKCFQQICDFQAQLKLADFHQGACQKQTEVLLLSKYHFQIVAHLRFEMRKIKKLPPRKRVQI